MNNYPSSNFATVFFLVIIFIGMGLLLYHAYEITVENKQLEDTVETLQANNTILKNENDILKFEMAPLKTQNMELSAENTSLYEEVSRLKALLEVAVAENISLKATDTDNDAELENLRRENSDLRSENLRIKMLQGSEVSHLSEEPVVLQSSFLPADLNFWMRLAAVILIAAILFISCTLYILIKDIRQRKAVAVYGKDAKNKANKRSGQYIDSHFTNR